MSTGRLLRLLALAMVVFMLGAAGLYVLVYLYRWEWNRAIVAGVFFLAALITLSTVLVLRGQRRLEQHLVDADVARERTRAALADENDRRAARQFDWLRRPPSSLGVFVPVLLGAGVLLSFVAFVLERLAGVVAGPTLDRRTAELVAPDLPLGDGPGAPAVERIRRSRWHTVGVAGLLLAAVAGMGVAIDAIGDATQSRPEIPAREGVTVIELRIEQRGRQRPADQVAAALWAACKGEIPPVVSATAAVGGRPGTATLSLDHQLGDLHLRRLDGCLGDLTIDLVIAHVEQSRLLPPPR